MTVEPQSDQVLVGQVLAGDVGAFATLVHRYRDRYARYAARMLGSGDDAEDVLQSVFLRAFRNLGGCSNPARFHAWLFQIVINECRTFATRRTRRDGRLVHDLRMLDTLDRSVVDESPIDRDVILRAVERLPTEQREAFLLKHVEELEYDEMAVLTGATVSALKMRVKRACERLRTLLEELDHVRPSF